MTSIVGIRLVGSIENGKLYTVNSELRISRFELTATVIAKDLSVKLIKNKQCLSTVTFPYVQRSYLIYLDPVREVSQVVYRLRVEPHTPISERTIKPIGAYVRSK